jgi:SpoVK/Ycf46/Vps4 family AAA+-type ATPase
MQNILLQELEDFEGILIATSNMNMNLDNAFERRFLYKVKFNKPDTKTRELIWQAKIADLSDKDAQRLAKDFVLTGGQIANVVRKYTLENILKDAAPNIEELRELCTTEFFGKNDRLIGFKKE